MCLAGVSTLQVKTEVSVGRARRRIHAQPLLQEWSNAVRNAADRIRTCFCTVLLENDGAQLPRRTTFNTEQWGDGIPDSLEPVYYIRQLQSSHYHMCPMALLGVFYRLAAV